MLGLHLRSPIVSTHSRPKAAGPSHSPHYYFFKGFNSQPPEGGWTVGITYHGSFIVSTHSRPKAAGKAVMSAPVLCSVSTHSRPKAAGMVILLIVVIAILFQLTAARRRLDECRITDTTPKRFQLTAARRRLGYRIRAENQPLLVSTHSRPKAAG